MTLVAIEGSTEKDLVNILSNHRDMYSELSKTEQIHSSQTPSTRKKTQKTLHNHLPLDSLGVLSDEDAPAIFRKPKDARAGIKENSGTVSIGFHLNSDKKDMKFYQTDLRHHRECHTHKIAAHGTCVQLVGSSKTVLVLPVVSYVVRWVLG